jgi:hypothetical protein
VTLKKIMPSLPSDDMNKRLRLCLLILLAVYACNARMLAAQARIEARAQQPALDSPLLNASDKSQVGEALRLQASLGDQVWPGFGHSRIPIILYNDKYEFLTGATNPPAPWISVEGDSFQSRPYYRRAAGNPQAFAVRIGATWAGSMSTRERMNAKTPLKITPDYHVVMILHEMFHAYQASQSPLRFARARAAYSSEDRYHKHDAAFAAAWNTEGSSLAAGLKANDDAQARLGVRQFLQARDARRARASLSQELTAYERELEWLEGLAKYVEIRFYELAASLGSDPSFADYKSGLPYWRPDLMRLEKAMGQQSGDLRFYLSGMAQARLLDRLSSGWQARAMRDEVYLEDLLRAAVGLNK